MQCFASEVEIVKQNVARLARIEIDRQRCLPWSRKARKIRTRLSVQTGRFYLAALRATRIKRFHAIEFDDRIGRGIYQVELRPFCEQCHAKYLSTS